MINVKKKLLKIAANVEDCYKMFNDVPNNMDELCASFGSVSCQNSGFESIPVVMETITDDLCNDNQPTNNDKYKDVKPMTDLKDCAIVKNSFNRTVQTCEVGIQVDLCGCSQFVKLVPAPPIFLLNHSFDEESCDDTHQTKARRKCATEKPKKKKSVFFPVKNFTKNVTKKDLQGFHTPNSSRVKDASSKDLNFKSMKHLVQKDKNSLLNISSSEELSFIVEKNSQEHKNNCNNKLNIFSSEEFTLQNPSHIPKKKDINTKALLNISLSEELSFVSERQSDAKKDKRTFLDISSSEEISFAYENSFEALQSLKRQGNKLRDFILESDSELTSSDINSQKKRISTGYESNAISILSESKNHVSFLASLSSDVDDHVIHPATKRFISNYHVGKMELTQLLYDFYNDKVFNGKLKLHEPIKWNIKLTKTAGYCVCGYRASKERYFRIEMSVKVCDAPDRLRDTLIHEMCHAYVWVEYGEHGGHGSYWRLWARKANIILRDLPPIVRCHDYVINTKYMYQCLKCRHKIGRYTKLNKLQCSNCAGRVQLISNNINIK